ncbi:MAG: hypothetical protein IKN81_09155 [Oscillospiraceae bacterium]|nr:hypothetical protein [Oscillospiraceae bacterium]
MKSEKARHTVWLTNEAWEKVKNHYRDDNCSTQNEYIEKAIRFYTGYLNARDAGAYLPRVLADVLEGKLLLFGDRIGKTLFKLAVQDAVMANLLAADTDVDLETLETLTGTCAKRVMRTHGVLDFEDALKFQKRMD